MKRILLAAAVAALAALLLPGAAAAHHARGLVLQPADIAFAPATDRCPVGIITFALRTIRGAPAGKGTACVKAVEPVGTTGQIARVVLRMQLAGGSLVVRATADETFLSETSLEQRWQGTVRDGTGRFRDARGRLTGGGIVAFNADGSVTSDVVWTVRLRRDRDGCDDR